MVVVWFGPSNVMVTVLTEDVIVMVCNVSAVVLSAAPKRGASRKVSGARPVR